jgi:hypothetical protein
LSRRIHVKKVDRAAAQQRRPFLLLLFTPVGKKLSRFARVGGQPMYSVHGQPRTLAILSPYRPDFTVDENRAAFVQMRDRLRHYATIRIRAVYRLENRQRDEQAFLVLGRPGRDGALIHAMRRLAADLGQASLLGRCGEEGDVFLHRMDGSRENVGPLTPRRLAPLYARMRSCQHDGFYTSVEFYRPVSVFRRTEIVLSPADICAEIEPHAAEAAAA